MTSTGEQQSTRTCPTATEAAPVVVPLSDPRAADPELTGTKAAALAGAAEAGLPVVPGFVVTTAGVDTLPPSAGLPDEVRDAWRRLSHDGEVPLVVRSSSTVEDLLRRLEVDLCVPPLRTALRAALREMRGCLQDARVQHLLVDVLEAKTAVGRS